MPGDHEVAVTTGIRFCLDDGDRAGRDREAERLAANIEQRLVLEPLPVEMLNGGVLRTARGHRAGEGGNVRADLHRKARPRHDRQRHDGVIGGVGRCKRLAPTVEPELLVDFLYAGSQADERRFDVLHVHVGD
ncbi:hypothetical protein [Tardibacter chloracetimidivorans]|uniref:hypothetical protein n=1 Tax=Tardibacter chloracetimidivorans TaxID=1921510 RepID=UPI001D03FBF1|nr:hypothetical protein [Tardibacter chloracetimidivorans]